MKKKLNPNFIKLVNMMRDGRYHDGNSMGETLKMTRSAIWKLIKKLETFDIRIDSVKGLGYALLEPLVLLEKNKIKAQLEEEVEIDIYETIDSTNDYLKLVKNANSIKICLAEQQTGGKGRLSREWYSPFGQNIYLSCLYPFRKDISELAGLSLVTSLAVVKTLQSYGVLNCRVKWPNDVVYDNKKLSGSLVEIQAESHGVSHAIIGIGLNVNLLNADGHISQGWTSIRKITGEYVDRNKLCARLINTLVAYLNRFDVHGFSLFSGEWEQADCLIDQTVMLKNTNTKIKGKVTGINEQGHLLLKLNNGSVRAFSSGDTSVMKKS